jgi:hypothetical protein
VSRRCCANYLFLDGCLAAGQCRVLNACSSSIMGLLVLTLIVEVMALATGENTPAVQNCDATAATQTRAAEPCSLAAMVAGRPFKIYPANFRFPRFTGTAALVCEPHRIPLAPRLNRGDHFGCTGPLPGERTTRLQELFALEMANI